MRNIKACIKASLFPVKIYKRGSSPFLISKYVPPLTQQILYTVYLYDLFKQYMKKGSWVIGGGNFLEN